MSCWCTIRPLTCDEVGKYVGFRVRMAGGAGETMFTGRALDLIYQVSEGVPRKINLICARSLETGFAALRPTIDETLVATAAEALELTRASPGAIPATRPRPGRVTVAPQTKRVLAMAAGVVAGVGLGAALTQAPWSQSVAPGVPALPAILATLALPQPVDLAAAAEPGVRQSYAIRTAAFATLRPADATAALIRELGADVAVAPLDGDAPRYVVWIGPYASLADARLMETVVKRRLGFLDARIVAGGLPSGRPR